MSRVKRVPPALEGHYRTGRSRGEPRILAGARVGEASEPVQGPIDWGPANSKGVYDNERQVCVWRPLLRALDDVLTDGQRVARNPLTEPLESSEVEAPTYFGVHWGVMKCLL
jgi:hypothetical protein